MLTIYLALFSCGQSCAEVKHPNLYCKLRYYKLFNLLQVFIPFVFFSVRRDC